MDRPGADPAVLRDIIPKCGNQIRVNREKA